MAYKKYASKDVAWEVINSIERGENIGYTAYSQLERIKKTNGPEQIYPEKQSD